MLDERAIDCNEWISQIPPVVIDAINAKSNTRWEKLIRDCLPDGKGGFIENGARQAALLPAGWRRLCLDKHSAEKMIKNRLWRLSNLYYFSHIEDGSDVLIDWDEPYLKEVFDAIFGGHEAKNVCILKTRQVFMTTALCCLFIDICRFTRKRKCGISNFNQDDVKDTMVDKLHYAFQHSPILQWDGQVNATSSELFFKHMQSRIQVEQTARGRTMHYMLLTEFAKTCLFQKAAAAETIRGMSSATDKGHLIIESTSQGPGGWFHETCIEAHELKKKGIMPDEKGYHFVFVPWCKKKRNVATRTARPEGLKIYAPYFEEVERENNIKLTTEQKNWWVSTLYGDARGDMQYMRQEHPGTVEEAFTMNDEALILFNETEEMIKEGRYLELSMGQRPCVCVWDFGYNDNTAFALFHDGEGGYTNCVYAYQNNKKHISHFISIIRGLNVDIAWHILPHDARVADSKVAQKLTETNQSMESYFLNSDIYNLHCLKRLGEKGRGFFASKHFMPNLRICSRRASAMFNSIRNVRRHYNRGLDGYEDKLERHSRHNHLYDCLEGAAILHADSPELFHPRKVSQEIQKLGEMGKTEINPEGYAAP